MIKHETNKNEYVFEKPLKRKSHKALHYMYTATYNDSGTSGISRTPGVYGYSKISSGSANTVYSKRGKTLNSLDNEISEEFVKISGTQVSTVNNYAPNRSPLTYLAKCLSTLTPEDHVNNGSGYGNQYMMASGGLTDGLGGWRSGGINCFTPA